MMAASTEEQREILPPERRHQLRLWQAPALGSVLERIILP